MLEFTEYRLAPLYAGASPPVPDGRELATQSLAIGGASVQSAAFNAAADLIVISGISADARICIGANPVAVAAGVGQTRVLKAGSEYSFAVRPGEKLAVINA